MAGQHLGCGAQLDDYLPTLGLEAGEFGGRGFRYVGEVFSACFSAVRTLQVWGTPI